MDTQFLMADSPGSCMKNPGLLPAFFLLAAALTGTANAQWSFDVEAGARHDSNLDNAHASDTVSDTALVTAVVVMQTLYLESGDSLSWGVGLRPRHTSAIRA